MFIIVDKKVRGDKKKIFGIGGIWTHAYDEARA